jgi:hypothetical protein
MGRTPRRGGGGSGIPLSGVTSGAPADHAQWFAGAPPVTPLKGVPDPPPPPPRPGVRPIAPDWLLRRLTSRRSPKPRLCTPHRNHAATPTSRPHLLSALSLSYANPTPSFASRIVKHARLGYATSPQPRQGA